MKILVVNNYKDLRKKDELVENLNRATGESVDTIDYTIANLKDRVEAYDPDAVVLSGSNFMLTKSDTRLVFQSEIDMIEKLHVPILGICYGHQLIGTAFGSQIVDLGRTIHAVKDVKIVARDRVFEGLPETIKVSESHRQALSKLPAGFQLLAESSTCKVEAMTNLSRPIYGFQFHPERSDEKNPYGQVIIQNFLRLARRS